MKGGISSRLVSKACSHPLHASLVTMGVKREETPKASTSHQERTGKGKTDGERK
jgi:hypothetical protein